VERAAFAKLALAQLRKARPDAVSVLHEDKFQIVTTTPDGKSSLTTLDNYYDEYCHAAPERKAGLLERIERIARVVESGEGLDEVRVMLVPRIRPRRYFDIDAVQLASELALKSDVAPKPARYIPFAEHLGIGLAIDRPEHIEYVADPSRFGVSGEELDEIALANLKRMTKEGLQEVHPGLWLGTWEDEYAAERMLMPELFTKIDVKGDPVAFLPGAERLYVVGSEDEAALSLAMNLVDERIKEPRGLLRFGFVLRDLGVDRLPEWRLFEPRGDLGFELGARLSMHLADAYAIQRKILEAKYEGDENAPFIAGVMGVGDEDGNVQLTVTTWGPGVHAFLPRAQVVAVGGFEAGESGMIPWDDVMELAGDCLAPVPDVYPPRWETKRFPDEATFAKLLARAKDRGGPEPADDRKSGTTAGVAPARASKLPIAMAMLVVVILGVVYAVTR